MNTNHTPGRFVKFHDLRTKKEWWVNPLNVLSFRADEWPGTAAHSAIEVKGNQGYGNHTIYVTETPDGVASSLMDRSAPALLAALEAMLAIAEQEARDTKYDNAKQTARAVIAQAKGETR